ncbi:protein angel2-like [Scleropages formosus]|uniref:Angel homolog 2 (Drosophila) n=1 Tax=Scleropages formosus TaxID=113540 RepID=A0A0P7V1U5_SCLFO|nr:protein angel homolog 2 [Scleropages formosus]KPP68302.1 protein angel2-like [Scleropages formosus]
MFARYLNNVSFNGFTRTRDVVGRWRTLWPLGALGQVGRAPWAQLPLPCGYLTVTSGIPDGWRCGGWRRRTLIAASGVAFRRAVHLSCALMEGRRNGPPHKRKRSSEERSVDSTPKNASRSSSPSHAGGCDPGGRNCDFCHNLGISESPRQEVPKPKKTARSAEIKRHWEDFSHLYAHPSQSTKRQRDPPFDFSVMSYNILSQELLQGNSWLYKHCQRSVLNWDHRLPNLLRELEQHNADILCLQEVQEDHYDNQIKPKLDSLGYHSEYKRRTGQKPDGCVVSFKRDHFSLVTCRPVEYFRHGVPLLDRDNVGLVLVLHPFGTPGSICVANTHLLYNPRRGDIKLAQLALLLAEISRASRAPGGSPDIRCPVILCGDFNSVPGSPLYNFIRESRLDYEGIPISKVSGQEQSPRGQRVLTVPIWPRSLGVSHRCQYETTPAGTTAVKGCLTVPDQEEGILALDRPSIEHSLRFTSAYSHYLKENGQPEVTTCHSKTAVTVDYIFYSAAQEDVSMQSECTTAPEYGLQLLARLALVDEKALWRANGLPNEHNSSDHLPLLVRFRLRCSHVDSGTAGAQRGGSRNLAPLCGTDLCYTS